MYATYIGDSFPEVKGTEYHVSQDVMNAYFVEQLNHIRNGKVEYLCSLNEFVSQMIDNRTLTAVRYFKTDTMQTLVFVS